MDHRPRDQRVLIAEAFLPLLFLAGVKIYFAVALTSLTAGLTLVVFEFLRRPLAGTPGIRAVYLFWLALCGGLGWIFAALPPYWIWSLHLLLPPGIWEASAAQAKRPFFSGFKKYTKRRVRELTVALAAGLLAAGAMEACRGRIGAAAFWIVAAAGAFVFEMLRMRIRERKK